MFDSQRNKPTDRVEILRVRNGFALSTPQDMRTCRDATIPYVFTHLQDVFDFLVSHDFECTDE